MRSTTRNGEVSRARLTATWLSREGSKISVARVAEYLGRAGVSMNLGLAKFEETVASDRSLRLSGNERQRTVRLRE